MRSPKPYLTAITLILVISGAIANLPILFSTPQVLAQTPQDRKAEADRLLLQGIKQFQTGQLEAVLQSWQQALKIYQEIKDRKGEGAALANLANAYKVLKNYPKIIECYKQYLPIARESKNRQGESDALFNIGLAYGSLQDYTKAIEYYEQGLPITREIKDTQNEFYTLGNLGIAHLQLKNYRKAIEYEQQYLVIARKIKDRPRELQGLKALAVAYQGLSDFPKALEYSQRGLDIAKEIKDRNGEGQLQGLLSMLYANLGYYPKAIASAQQSLAIAKEIKIPEQEGYALENLGNIYVVLGETSKAVEYYQQSLVISRKIKNRNGEGTLLGNLGNNYAISGDYLKAIESYEQRLAIAREIKDDLGELVALGNLGISYMILGNHPKGIEYYQQELTKARKIKDRLGEGSALSHFGGAYIDSGEYSKAIEHLQQALVIAQELKDAGSKKIALNSLGLAFYKQENLTLAESNLIEAIKLQESLRLRAKELKDIQKISLYDQQRSSYETLQQVFIAQNKTDAALEISERGRGRAFVELLTSRIFSNSKEQLLTPPTIAEIKQIARLQNATLVQYSIISDKFKVEGKIQFKESELYIWVINSTGEVTFRKVDLKPLWQKENTTLPQLVTTSRQAIGARGTAFRGINVTYNPNAPKAKNNLKRLHELLINPIADLLPKNPNERVIFIPQNALFLVPFAALQDAESKYLIEKHTILTSPSIQVLDLTRKQRQRLGTKPIQGKDTLIVGNPTMPFFAPKIDETPQQLTPLPGAEKEATAISKLLKTAPLIGNKATESTVIKRLPQARFVHLATHGIFDDIQGLNSAIALTPSGQDDGLLTASEILDLKLNAELVVLSACDTGRGRISGDGVIGLSRSLISAGVPSVLVSLWAVPDAPTARLMTQFYQNLQKNPDKAQALRQAMLTTMKTNPNPVDWAAFTLIGEAE
ncbi:Fis family transcriptional regulator [Nostoc sp. CENA543]|uniref:CHAT domain-containing protein n=1 Tax=Nostoc sp. CENA543 TaxID=1869241 RepID=UPI000CA287B3|nr:CHAT domain-containing protein [Nostoc sp. CENA543]AUT00319.1 Fis family transcriptional regulator [Nostoc sp. CENA543]